MAQIRVLDGLLPICASCKRIRDDDGSWHQVEVYVRDHSDAEFSHSLCPDCLTKLYPEYTGAEPSAQVPLTFRIPLGLSCPNVFIGHPQAMKKLDSRQEPAGMTCASPHSSRLQVGLFVSDVNRT